MKTPIPPKVQKFPAAKQRRLDQLLDKNSEGHITPKEAAALKQLVNEAEQLMVANGKRRALPDQAEGETGKAKKRKPPAKDPRRKTSPGPRSLAERLANVMGKATGLPADASVNHDHYLYGLPKQE